MRSPNAQLVARRAASAARRARCPMLHEAQRVRSTSSSPRRPTFTATSGAGTTTPIAPDTLRGLTRVATIIDSLRRVVRGTAGPRRRRRHVAGQPAHFRRRARRLDDAASGHRRDERDAVRRGGSRQSRVQLRVAHARPRDAPSRTFRCLAANVFTARRQAAISRAGRVAIARRNQDRDRRRDDAGLDGVGSRQSRRTTRGSRHRPRRCERPFATRASAGAEVVIVVAALRARRAVELRHRVDRACRARTSPRVSRARCRASTCIVYGHSHKEMADTVIGSDAAHAAEELGDERRDRASHGRSGRTGGGASSRSAVTIVQAAAPQRERAGPRGDAGRASRRVALRDDRRSDRRRSHGAPTRRASSTRR